MTAPISDSVQLEHQLKRTVKGEVRFDAGSRALYATDASNYRQVPIGVVVPRDEDDVIATVSACRQVGAPVLPRGGGTSLAGQCCNVAVVLDFSKYMNRILEIDAAGQFARVQPGVVLDSLRARADDFHLTFGPDPSTHSRCTLGGMIGNNSCGTHSLLAGKTVDNVDELHVVLYDGTELTVGATMDTQIDAIVNAGGRRGDIYARLRSIRDRYGRQVRDRFPNIPRRVSGYNLDELLPERGFHVARALVGSEGTCAIVLDAKVKLVRSPPHRSLVGLGYADAFLAADHVPDILTLKPIGLEGFEGAMVDGLARKGAANLDLLPPGRGVLLVEFGGDEAAQVRDVASVLMKQLATGRNAPSARLYSAAEARAVWKLREAGPRAAANVPGMPPRWEGWDDASVAPEKLGPYLRELRDLLNRFGYQATFYGHFGHGCIHMQVSFDLQSQQGIAKYARFVDAAADLVVRYGGSLSGEHGDGQSRGALLPKMFGPEVMAAFREFKTAWDPDGKMNPGKLVDAHAPTDDLRLGERYSPRQAATHFAFADDGGSFAKATLRCIGIGECRKESGGTMCPSYMATREEAHSTRGRAHLLFELLHGDVLADSWQDEHVKRALDLCLSCKACKSECPTNVDIATYRAEFLSHYYERRRRPLSAYAFGFVDRWLRMAAWAPKTMNALANVPVAASIARAGLGISPQRRIPPLADRTFLQWASERHLPTAGGDVMLWVDTFNNAFHPQTLRAALDVLAHAGLHVNVPPRQLCCGRPLYDFGFLDRAEAYLKEILDSLGDALERGTPIVVLEPSCASVFRDELCNLFPNDPRATRLRDQTMLLSELLERRNPAYAPPALPRKVLLHGHCHHKALMKISDEESLLRRSGAEVTSLDSGCCGMAGAFGFEHDKFAVSQAIGERVLLPAVRGADAETLIVTDGFSCREQIFQATGRRALHLADALHLGLLH